MPDLIRKINDRLHEALLPPNYYYTELAVGDRVFIANAPDEKFNGSVGTIKAVHDALPSSGGAPVVGTKRLYTVEIMSAANTPSSISQRGGQTEITMPRDGLRYIPSNKKDRANMAAQNR